MTSVIPTLRYRDPEGAIRWLVDVLGMSEHMIDRGTDGEIRHAQLKWRSGYVMLGIVQEGDFGSAGPAMNYLIAPDAESIDFGHQRAVEAGAEVIMPPTEQDYGSREYALRDPEGNVWAVGTYDPDH